MTERKSPDLKLLHGNPGNRPVSAKGKSTTGRPVPPADLKGEAFAEWSRVTSYLATVGQIETIDYAALVVYCSAWAAFNDARYALDEHGPLVLGRDGGYVKNPAAQIMKDSAGIMLNYGGRFGFTPKDRQNMGLGGKADTGAGDLDDALGAL